MSHKMKRFIYTTFLSCLGAVIYAIGINRFLVPMGFFAGSLTGIAQIVNDLLHKMQPSLPELTGAILFAMNIPLMILSFKAINRLFFVKTIITLTLMTSAMQWIPSAPIEGLTDPLTAILVGGLIAGFGAGLSLRAGGSGGGVDILGVYVTQKKPGFSVGKVSLAIGLIVYAYSLFSKPLTVVIYSVLFTFIYSKTVDYTHHQNIKTALTIITSKPEVLDYITTKLRRGATYWDGKGAYTHAPLLVINTVVSKYEMMMLRREVRKIDPQIFIMETPNVSVTGTYDAHLFED